jgi:hypothetical protein
MRLQKAYVSPQQKERNKKARQQYKLKQILKNPNMVIENIGDFEPGTFNVERYKSIQNLIKQIRKLIKENKKLERR